MNPTGLFRVLKNIYDDYKRLLKAIHYFREKVTIDDWLGPKEVSEPLYLQINSNQKNLSPKFIMLLSNASKNVLNVFRRSPQIYPLILSEFKRIN